MARIAKRKRARQRVSPAKANKHKTSARSQVSLENAAHVLTRMREGYSLTGACAEYGIDARTVECLAGSALRKGETGRYAAKPTDRLLRTLVVPVRGGLKEYTVHGSRAASQIASRSAAQGYFLATGDDSKLRKLRGVVVKDSTGREIPFLSDLDELERLGDAGLLQYESIYARRA